MDPYLEVTYEFHNIDPQRYRNIGYGSREDIKTMLCYGTDDATALALRAAELLDLPPGEYLAVQRPHDGAVYGEGEGTFIPGWSVPVKVTEAKKLFIRNR
jgi:hypothetical protein